MKYIYTVHRMDWDAKSNRFEYSNVIKPFTSLKNMKEYLAYIFDFDGSTGTRLDYETDNDSTEQLTTYDATIVGFQGSEFQIRYITRKVKLNPNR